MDLKQALNDLGEESYSIAVEAMAQAENGHEAFLTALEDRNKDAIAEFILQQADKYLPRIAEQAA